MSEHSRPSEYVTPSRLAELRRALSDRDWALLSALSRHSYATTSHIRRALFADHATLSAGTRAAVRVLDRLLQHRLVARLDRRVGGSARGSAAFIWHLDVAGERLTRADRAPRRRFGDPSLVFLEHCLQVTETAVLIAEAATHTELQLTRVDVETTAWRNFLDRPGVVRILKPDLFITLSTAEFHDHWYIEVDRGTESLPVLLVKCRTYAAYRRTGRAQAEHGVFPRVLWVVPTQRRVGRLLAAIQADPDLPARLFTVITPDELVRTIRDPPDP